MKFSIPTGLLFLFVLFLAGCAADQVVLNPVAGKIKVAKSDPLPDDYQELSPINVQDGQGCGAFGAYGSYDGALNMLKNKAAQMGADLIFITSDIPPHSEPSCGVNAYLMSAKTYRAVDPEPEARSFEEAVQAYQRSSVKPILSEEARKFKVQAELEVRAKNYRKAAVLYGRALNLDPWWAEGHFNRAIVLHESNYYDGELGAIREMKRYLELVPDATDARDAQNKIYEWELKTESPSQ